MGNRGSCAQALNSLGFSVDLDSAEALFTAFDIDGNRRIQVPPRSSVLIRSRVPAKRDTTGSKALLPQAWELVRMLSALPEQSLSVTVQAAEEPLPQQAAPAQATPLQAVNAPAPLRAVGDAATLEGSSSSASAGKLVRANSAKKRGSGGAAKRARCVA